MKPRDAALASFPRPGFPPGPQAQRLVTSLAVPPAPEAVRHPRKSPGALCPQGRQQNNKRRQRSPDFEGVVSTFSARGKIGMLMEPCLAARGPLIGTARFPCPSRPRDDSRPHRSAMPALPVGGGSSTGSPTRLHSSSSASSNARSVISGALRRPRTPRGARSAIRLNRPAARCTTCVHSEQAGCRADCTERAVRHGAPAARSG